jgi:amidase
MKQSDYVRYDGLALAGLIRERAVSSHEVVLAAIRQIESVNATVNAVCWTRFEKAIDDAIRFDVEPETPGPFAGVPFLLKDALLAVKDFPLTSGSRLFSDFRCAQDSSLAVRLRNAGFNFLGRTTTPEFSANCTTEAVLYGAPTRNPWNLELSPGGSSGGAAAAVAAGISPLAHGTDGGGSIRIPASCCGLFGLKPSRMRNPTGPRGEGWGGMGVEHVLTRTVRDSAAVLDATHGPDVGAPYAAPHFGGHYLDLLNKRPPSLRIGLIVDSPSGQSVHPECIRATQVAAECCEHLGHKIIPTRLPDCDFEAFGYAMRVVVSVGIAQAVKFAGTFLNRQATLQNLEFSSFTALEMAYRHNAVDYADAVNRFHQIGRTLGGAMTDYDVILTPGLTAPPVALGTYAADREYVEHRSATLLYTAFLPYLNATGQPAMSVPLYWTASGLPIGVQFAAAIGREDLLLRLGAQLEEAAPWFSRIAQLAGAS